MQAESEQIVRLLVVLDEFLEFVEHVTLNEAVERSIDVQGIDVGEASADEQLQDGFQLSQRAQRPLCERGGQRPGHQERNDVRVGSSEAAELTGDGTQLG